MTQPLVSIIIPTYNRAHLIGETLNSVLAQTYTNWECIIVDDGSTDNTAELLKTYCEKDVRFQYHHRPQNRPKGANACRNYGFELCSGEYVNWFDSDDIMNHDLLQIKTTIFNKNPEINFVVCGMETIDKEGKSKVFNITEVNNYLEDYLNDKIVLNSLNILWESKIVTNCEWDVSVHKYQDLDFIFRMLYKGLLKGAFINKNLITIKVHSNSISKTNNKKYNTSRLKVRERMYELSKGVMSLKMQLRLYHLYLFEFRNILSQSDYKLCIKALQGNIIKEFNIKLNLLMYIFLHMFTKRGMVKLTNYLIKIST